MEGDVLGIRMLFWGQGRILRALKSSDHKKEPHGGLPCGPSGWDIGKLPIPKYHIIQNL